MLAAYAVVNALSNLTRNTPHCTYPSFSCTTQVVAAAVYHYNITLCGQSHHHHFAVLHFRAATWRGCLLSPSSASAVQAEQHHLNSFAPEMHQSRSPSPKSRAASRLAADGNAAAFSLSKQGMWFGVTACSSSGIAEHLYVVSTQKRS